MSEENSTTAINYIKYLDSANYELIDCKLTTKKYLGRKFCNKAIKRLQQTDKPLTDTEMEAIMADYKSKFTLSIQLDFTGCKIKQILDQFITTTSVTKMLYNNTLQNLNETEAEELCESLYIVKVMDIWSDRKSTALTDTDKMLRLIKKTGMTKEQILAMFEDEE